MKARPGGEKWRPLAAYPFGVWGATAGWLTRFRLWNRRRLPLPSQLIAGVGCAAVAACPLRVRSLSVLTEMAARVCGRLPRAIAHTLPSKPNLSRAPTFVSLKKKISEMGIGGAAPNIWIPSNTRGFPPQHRQSAHTEETRPAQPHAQHRVARPWAAIGVRRHSPSPAPETGATRRRTRRKPQPGAPAPITRHGSRAGHCARANTVCKNAS